MHSQSNYQRSKRIQGLSTDGDPIRCILLARSIYIHRLTIAQIHFIALGVETAQATDRPLVVLDMTYAKKPGFLHRNPVSRKALA
ncbi:MAG TPA: hypothetical protein DCY88_10385 [Cyanobacteria bacterium UBA11372]|nr:hypothetical protein [Cyanobacteria bacterium UBA11372]